MSVRADAGNERASIHVIDGVASVDHASGWPRQIDPLALAKETPPARNWFIDGLLPERSNVLLAAHGGSGKTLLILHMAVCIACGLPFFGLPTRRSIVLMVLAEDDRAEIHRRLVAICTALGYAIESLAGRIFIYDGVGCDVALFGRRGAVDDRGRPVYTAAPDITDAYDWLWVQTTKYQAEVVFLDSTSDMFDGDESRRAEVRRYMNATLALVLPRGGCVLHTAHVDKFVARGGAAQGNTYSGSTAWNNSVRARLSLTRPKVGDDEDPGNDDGRRVLTVEKLNYGKPGWAVPLRFDEDRQVFVHDGDVCAGGMVGAIRSRTERRAILACLSKVAAAGRNVMTSPRANDNASTILGPLPSFPKAMRTAIGRKRLFGLLYAMEAEGAIEREAFKTAARHNAERWRVTEAGQKELADAS